MTIESQRPLLIQAEAVYHDAAAAPRLGRHRAEEIAEAARKAGDPEALSTALRAAGYAARELYEHEDARRLLGEAARVARREGLPRRLSEALITRSAMHIELGHPHRARRDLDEAHAVAPPALRAEIDFADGLLADKTGDFAAAAEAYRRALDKLRRSSDVLRVKALNNLALTVARFGRYREADRLLEEAIGLARHRWTAREGVATESYALVAVDSGRPVEALRRYRRAEQLLTEVGVQLVDLYLGKARALLTLRLLDEAADAAERAVREVEGRVGGSMMLAEALMPRAQIALARRRPGEALAFAVRAERLFRGQRRTGWRAFAALLSASAQLHIGVDQRLPARLARVEQTMSKVGDLPHAVQAAYLQGEAAAVLGQSRRARNAFGRAATVARDGPLLARLQGRAAAARKAELEGDARRLGQMCRLGLDELTSYRATLASAELRARAAGHGTILATIGLRAALRSGRPEQIWAWMERSGSVVFVRDSSDSAPLSPMLAQLRALEGELGELSPDDGVARARLLGRVTALEHRVRSVSWTRDMREDRWASPTVHNLRRLRTVLGNRALLQYGVADGRLCAVVVTPDRIVFGETGSLAKAVTSGRQLAFALRRLIEPGRSSASLGVAMDSAHHELRWLAETLLNPIARGLSGAEEVIVAPPGELIGIPWGSLAPIADRPVRVVPSALSWWHTHRRSPANRSVVLVAGPGLDGATDEICGLARRYDAATTLTGQAATTEAVRRAASGAALVHVAAHGRLRSDSPTFSSIQLSDGPLTVHDLEGLVKPAHRWVLASCDLGHPGMLAGSALEGVLAALLSGGSAAIVAATVSVPDLDTKDLMMALHDGLATGESLAEALRRARGAVGTGEPEGLVASTAFSCYGGG